MSRLAIIGGSGLAALPGLDILQTLTPATPWGAPSAPVTLGQFKARELLFLPRHGPGHTIPPHRVNYRANIQALKDCGAAAIIAVNAVGGITPALAPGRIVIPAQIIDYTWGREHTFQGAARRPVNHIDFTRPYTEALRQRLIAAAARTGAAPHAGGTHAVTQGPRLETAAEIERLERDGADIVGMTGMPEAALARELEIDYACCALVVNRAAGKGDERIDMAMIEHNLKQGMQQVLALLARLIDTRRG